MKKLLFSSDLEWMRPYVKKVNHIVPVQKIEKVISFKPRKDRVQHGHAGHTIESWLEGRPPKKKKRIYITINLYFWKLESLKPVKRKLSPFSKIDLLESLAHELAHAVDFDHTTRHKKLEAKMKSMFMTMLEKEGYISEEHELKHNPPKF